MAAGFGTDAWLGFAEESTYGTYVPATKFIEITEESIECERSIISRPSLRTPSVTSVVQGKTSVSGSFKCQLGYEGFDRLIKHTLGGTPTTTGTGPYTHSYTPTSALPTGLSFHLNRSAASVGTGSAFKFMGCQIQSMTISIAPEEEAMVEFSILGREFGNLNVETPTFPTLELLDWTGFSAFLGGNFDDYIKLRSFEITIDNSLADDRYNLGSGLRVGLGRNGPRKISGKFVTEFDSMNLFDEFRNQTTTNAGISGDFIFGNGKTGTDERRLSIFPYLYFESVSMPVKDAGVILAEASFSCIGTSGNDEITIQTMNSLATI